MSEDVPDRDRPPPLDQQIELDPDRARSLARSIFAGSVEGILTIDSTGRIRAMNPAASRIFGHAPQEVQGQGIDTLLPPPFRDMVPAWLHGAAADTGRPVQVVREVKGLRKDGSVFPMELSLLDVLWDHQRLLVGIVRDTSEKQAMQEALRRERDFAERLIELAPAVVLVLDHDGRVIRFNRFFAELTGWKVEDVLGADWFDTFLPPEERAWAREGFATLVRGGRAAAPVVHLVATRDGRRLPVEWHSAPLVDRGRVLGVLALGLDITERRRLEQQFLQAQKMEAVGRLAGGIAHDFNNLLMGIIGGCRLGAEQLDPAHPTRALLDEMGAAAERGVGLTRQLLAFSRRETVRREPVDVGEVVRRVHAIARHVVGDEIAVATHLTGDNSVVVGDPAQMEQVVMNLVVNARDAMPNGGNLDIDVCERTLTEPAHGRAGQLAPGRYVELAVRDTGVGMDSATQARIFEPFFTTKGPGKGTGLGLSTVFGIVARMGGSVSVESAPGCGTTFTVILPQAEIAARRPAAATVESLSRPLRGHETILLVEDDQLVRTMVLHALASRGYRVLAAKDATEALDLAATAHPLHLVLADVSLPDLSGPDLTRRLSTTHPTTRVLYMSAHPHDYLVEAGKLRADEPSLEKPFTDVDLAARIRAMLDSPRA
ncbi:MAG: PAS domain S-box protein [Planctomycetota bacterium]